MTNPKKQSPEYRLLIAPQFSEIDQTNKTLFLLETTRLFTNFTYELSVEEHLDGKVIRFNILGIRPPQLSLPAIGPARFTREYENLRGIFEVVIQGLDGSLTSCSVQIQPKRVKLLKSPSKKFVDVIVNNKIRTAN
ncbi:MAG: hypothetical protein O7D34_06375 [Ignavibacteria bacterium]|nr:hypothetical protein [Ignavibacteria bacterium]